VASPGYHERIWQAVPERSQPAELQLRSTFLLARLRRVQSAPRLREDAPAPRPRVLDVGCGAGQITSAIARAGFDVVGIDLAEEPLRRARSRDPTLELRLVGADGDWPFADSSFDAVWAGETIEHVLDTAAWLSEVRRVLRSGGLLALSTPSLDRPRLLAAALSTRRFDELFDPRGDHVRFYSRRTLATLLGEFGFQQVELVGAGGPPWSRRTLLASAVRSRF
jgi:2-polyprenyl-3-methyl-5-hydroxy-6-metoxy-1,4-benzoquinol methylase